MSLTIDAVQAAVLKKGYIWYADRPNIVGVRSAMDVPNVFNDVLCLSWTQTRMPAGLDIKGTQNWLNRNMVHGEGMPGKLKEDGVPGAATNAAMKSYGQLVGKRRARFYQITTDPGTYWLTHPSNVNGTAILKPGQYQDCWSLGYHHGKQDHPALVQTAPVTVYRDNDHDVLSDETAKTDTGLFGINIHGASPTGTSVEIGRWSAGCNVFSSRRDLFDMLALLHLYRGLTGNKFTYTLLLEREIA
jgi:hypothetical protein